MVVVVVVVDKEIEKDAVEWRVPQYSILTTDTQ